MQERIFNLLEMCLQAKKKGHDVTFDYSSHVQAICVRIFESGWISNANPTKSFYFYIDENRDVAITEENIQEIANVESYLKELTA